MKKIFFVICGFLILSLSGGGLYAQERITLSYAHPWPAAHFLHAQKLLGYAKILESATKGKYIIDIKWYPAGTLLTGGKVFDGVLKGVVDMGNDAIGYNPGRFPVMQTLNQCGIAPPKSADAASRAAWEFFNALKPKEFADVKMLFYSGTGPGWLHSHKPITKIEQLKGMKIRVTGTYAAGAKALGGEPVATPMGEVYLAAKKGIVEAAITPAETLEGYKHAEVFKYSTFMPYTYSEFQWEVMNLAKWNSLPKDLRDIIESVSDEAVKHAGQVWQYNMKQGEEYAKRQPGGHEFIYLSDEEVKKLAELLKPIEKEYTAYLNSKGLEGEKIVKTAKQIMEKCNKLTYEPLRP